MFVEQPRLNRAGKYGGTDDDAIDGAKNSDCRESEDNNDLGQKGGKAVVKSRIQETLNLLTFADSITNTKIDHEKGENWCKMVKFFERL